MNSPEFTRRDLLQSIAGVLQPKAVSSPVQGQGGLQLISPDSLEFDESISRDFPDLQDAAFYQAAKQYMVILKHAGTSRAKAYSVVWTHITSTGDLRPLWAYYIHKHSMPKSAERHIDPGGYRLVTPFFNISPAEYSSRKASVIAGPPNDFPYLNDKLQSVELDCVIFADHTATGVDKYRLRARYRSTRNAEHDEGVSIARKIQTLQLKNDPKQIDQILQEHVAYASNPQASRSKKVYVTARAQEAAILRAILSTYGFPQLRRQIGARLRFPRERLAKLT